MPYTVDSKDLPEHVLKMDAKGKKKWVATFNATMKKCEEEGGKDCEASAFKIANSVMKETGKAKEAAQDAPEGQEEKVSETMYWVPYGVHTFADLQAAEEVYEAAEEMRLRVDQFQQIVSNIMYSNDVPDKVSSLRALVDEFAQLMGGASAGIAGSEAAGTAAVAEAATVKARAKSAVKALASLLEDKAISDSLRKQIDGLREALKKNWKDLEAEADEEWGHGKTDTAELAECRLSEAESGAALLVEADGGQDLVRMKVRLIRPGWGNTKDNHFYSPEALAKAAESCKGVKMYETDHRQAEKSTRTWVSTIEGAVPDGTDGSLIGDVVVHAPDFAQRVRNLKAANLLEKMECSILADGMARPNFERDGRKGKYIESITKWDSVDWVTRAGAGGAALSIAESEEGMDKTETPAVPGASTETPAVPVAENAPQGNSAATPAAPVVVAENQPPAQPVVLAAETVTAKLGETRLPAVSRARLAERQYADEAALTAAIAGEIAYIKELTGSGQPFAQGASTPVQPEKLSETEIQKGLDEVDKRYGLR